MSNVHCLLYVVCKGKIEHTYNVLVNKSNMHSFLVKESVEKKIVSSPSPLPEDTYVYVYKGKVETVGENRTLVVEEFTSLDRKESIKELLESKVTSSDYLAYEAKLNDPTVFPCSISYA